MANYDYVIGGKRYDIYDIKKKKADAVSVKKKLKSRYKSVRILKKSDGYHIVVN